MAGLSPQRARLFECARACAREARMGDPGVATGAALAGLRSGNSGTCTCEVGEAGFVRGLGSRGKRKPQRNRMPAPPRPFLCKCTFCKTSRSRRRCRSLSCEGGKAAGLPRTKAVAGRPELQTRGKREKQIPRSRPKVGRAPTPRHATSLDARVLALKRHALHPTTCKGGTWWGAPVLGTPVRNDDARVRQQR